MKCISRSTGGVILGTCNILIYLGVGVLAILDLVAINAINKDRKAQALNVLKKENYDADNYPWDEDKNDEGLKDSMNDAAITIGTTVFIIILVVALIMIIISGLLIVGIVKRRHSLMAPWLVLSAIGFVSSCIRTALDLFAAVAADVSIGEILFVFTIKSLTLCLTAFILYIMYTLYRDIRDKNNGLPGQMVTAEKPPLSYDYPTKSNDYYYAVPQKA